MWNEIAAWQEQLHLRPDLSAKTIALYTQDVRRFATWLQQEHPGLGAIEVTPTDAKTYRDHLLAKRYAPTTINRALISLIVGRTIKSPLLTHKIARSSSLIRMFVLPFVDAYLRPNLKLTH